MQRFGVLPDISFVDDSQSPNAYATKEVSNANYPDGQVCIGLTLINREFSNGGSGLTVALVMAHEFGHIADFKFGTSLTGKYKELFADYMAGIYMDIKFVQLGVQQPTSYIQEGSKKFYKIGDYAFNNPGHHGTPDQRRDCLMKGYNFSYNKRSSGQGYGIKEAMDAAAAYVRTIP